MSKLNWSPNPTRHTPSSYRCSPAALLPMGLCRELIKVALGGSLSCGRGTGRFLGFPGSISTPTWPVLSLPCLARLLSSLCTTSQLLKATGSHFCPNPCEAHSRRPGPVLTAQEVLNKDVTQWLNSTWLMVFGNYLLTIMELFVAIRHCSETQILITVLSNLENGQSTRLDWL